MKKQFAIPFLFVLFVLAVSLACTGSDWDSDSRTFTLSSEIYKACTESSWTAGGCDQAVHAKEDGQAIFVQLFDSSGSPLGKEEITDSIP